MVYRTEAPVQGILVVSWDLRAGETGDLFFCAPYQDGGVHIFGLFDGARVVLEGGNAGDLRASAPPGVRPLPESFVGGVLPEYLPLIDEVLHAPAETSTAALLRVDGTMLEVRPRVIGGTPETTVHVRAVFRAIGGR